MTTGNASLPRPVGFAPSQSWDGNDGSWSTFIIRVGNPAQDFRVLPSTAGQETVVPIEDGCTATDPSDCGQSRGVIDFHGAASKGLQVRHSATWSQMGLYNLDLETALGLGTDGAGLYGLDTVGLQIEGSGGPTLANQVVAGVATKQFYLGVFGLGVKPANFSTFDPESSHPAYLPSLKANGTIPSLSYGYTAGSPYRYQKVLGSLTIGGYDRARAGNVSDWLPFGPDDSRNLLVKVERITATNTLKGTISPLPSPLLSLIDSTVPHIWMPQDACDAFEDAFGLVYDNATELYTVNDTTHSQLVQNNPSVNFQLSLGANTVNIELPYAAFDLSASYPIYANKTMRYFPIRRAANESQYVLGRTLLQEAYLTVDYERSRFAISQVQVRNPSIQDIVTIFPSNWTEPAMNGLHDSLSAGAVGGLSAGLGVIAALICVVLLFFWKRHSRRPAPEAEKLNVEVAAAGENWQQTRPLEADSNSLRHLLYTKECAELPSSVRVLELEQPAKRIFELETPTRA